MTNNKQTWREKFRDKFACQIKFGGFNSEDIEQFIEKTLQEQREEDIEVIKNTGLEINIGYHACESYNNYGEDKDNLAIGRLTKHGIDTIIEAIIKQKV